MQVRVYQRQPLDYSKSRLNLFIVQNRKQKKNTEKSFKVRIQQQFYILSVKRNDSSIQCCLWLFLRPNSHKKFKYMIILMMSSKFPAIKVFILWRQFESCQVRRQSEMCDIFHKERYLKISLHQKFCNKIESVSRQSEKRRFVRVPITRASRQTMLIALYYSF